MFFANGDFDADFTNYSLLVMYSSELLHLPTNNGEHFYLSHHQDG